MRTNCPPHFRFLRIQYCKIMVLIPFIFILTCANKESDTLATKNPSDSNWVYQLQNPKIKNLANSEFPLAVIDYSSGAVAKPEAVYRCATNSIKWIEENQFQEQEDLPPGGKKRYA